MANTKIGIRSSIKKEIPNDFLNSTQEDIHPDSIASAVSWSAILAGAAAATALGLALLVLGMGLGLSLVSPWTRSGISAKTFGVSAILWLGISQVIAYGIGGYVAGRLRTRWLSVHTKEVFFRDTAHGFLTWAMASIVTATLLTTVITSIISSGTLQSGAAVAEGMANTAIVATTGGGAAVESLRMRADISNFQHTHADPMTGSIAYLLDALFRPELNLEPVISISKQSKKSDSEYALHEVAGILLNNIQSEVMPIDDLRYVGQLVALHTGLVQRDAELRVADTFTKLQANLANAEMTSRFYADKARKTSAKAALWVFVSMFIGVLAACYAATYGGRCRDRSR